MAHNPAKPILYCRASIAVCRLTSRCGFADFGQHSRRCRNQGIDDDRLIEARWQDEKATRGMTFVLDGTHGAEIVPGVAEDVVRRTPAAC
jgi:hypothetical protein